MSKKPFDLLLTDREPLVFFEKTIIRMDDGELVALNKVGRFVIQPASTLMIYLGAGTSITQEAAIFASLNDCFISFSRGSSYVHSVWHSGRWSDPRAVVNQVNLHSNDNKRLEIAKQLILKRLANEFVNITTVEKINGAKNINELLGYEANWAKNVYREEAEFAKIKFTRDFNSNDMVNSRLNLLNNALYSIISSIVISVGLHPSVGFIHGKSRRGGLCFDLADIYKYELTIKPSFRMPENMEYKQIMFHFNNGFKKDNFKIIREVVEICLKIANGDEKVC